MKNPLLILISLLSVFLFLGCDKKSEASNSLATINITSNKTIAFDHTQLHEARITSIDYPIGEHGIYANTYQASDNCFVHLEYVVGSDEQKTFSARIGVSENRVIWRERISEWKKILSEEGSQPTVQLKLDQYANITDVVFQKNQP